MTRCKFMIEDMTEDEFIIRDIGHGECCTVTNDVDAVVRELTPIINGRRLLYIDTDGRKDEILHENGVFLGFNCLPQEGE